MSYQEYKPSELLSGAVDSYWFAVNSGKPSESRILPDGYVDIIFNLGKATPTLAEWSVGISGMMTRYRDISSHADSELIGVRFKPGHLNTLCPVPFSEFKNASVNASEIIPELNSTIPEKLYERKNNFQRLAFIEEVLLTLMNKKKGDEDRLIQAVCASIAGPVSAPVNFLKLADDHCISLRQLERRFKAAVGLSMKEYHSIIRFNKTIKNIAQNPEKSFADIAFEMGYFDHSHLTKEINRMAGKNPSLFR